MSNEDSGCGIKIGGGLFGTLFIIMFIMKVLGIGAVANWSWWWITAPLWGPVLVSLLILIVWLIIYLITK